MSDLRKFFRPARARAVENNLNIIGPLLCFLRKSETVEYAPQRFIAAFGIGQDNNGNFHFLFLVFVRYVCTGNSGDTHTVVLFQYLKSGHNRVGYLQIGENL